MSIQESPVGHSQGKAGLKRKLTGPPRLLLGKSQAKSHVESQDDTWSRSHIDRSNSIGTNRGTMATQQCTIREEGLLECTSQNSLKPIDSSEEQVSPKNPSESEKCTTSNESETKTEHLEDKSNPKRQSMKRGCKRFFYPALTCIRRRRKRLGTKSPTESTQTADVTFCTMHPREFVVSGTEPTTGDAVTTKEEQDVETSNLNRGGARKGRVRFSVGTWQSIKRLLTASNNPPRTKGQSQHDEHFGCEDVLQPNFSIKKKVGCFLKYGAKKPSPFYHEQLGSDHEYIEEETIVLSNTHADDASQRTTSDVQEGEQLDGDRENKGQCSETLTVSAEVSVMEEGDRGEGSFTETHTDQEDFENVTNASYQGENEEDQQEFPEIGLEVADGIVTKDSPEAGGLPPLVINEMLIEDTPRDDEGVKDDSAFSQPIDVALKTQEGPLEGHDLRLPVDTHLSLCVNSDAAVAHEENMVEENMLPSRGTDEDSMQDDLSLKNVEFDILDLRITERNTAVENGPDVSSEENFHKGDTGHQYDQDLSSKYSDILLVETACSLVQTALKAALDQLTAELKDKSAGINTET